MGIECSKTGKILRFKPRGKMIMSYEDEPKTTTSITLTTKVIDLIKQDASRCRRSMAGQMQAIFDKIYLNADVELHGTESYTPSIELPQEHRKAS